MSELDKVSARRLAKILQKQIADTLSTTILGSSNTEEMRADTVNTINAIMNRAPVDGYSVAPPILANFKGIDKDFIITKNGHYRPRYEVYLNLTDGSQIVLKTSRSLRKIKTYYNTVDITQFMWCDISFKPTEPVEYITLKVKVERNA